jgi:hypothetical protein
MTDTEKLLAWSLGDDTGSSSKALAREAAGLPMNGRWGYPSDGGDLGRCVRLIEAVPSARAAVDRLAAKNQYWAALAPEWDRLTALLKTDKDAVYPSMKAILDKREAKDPNIVKLGNGASMRFGR